MKRPAEDAGYLLDLEYTGNYYSFLAPARLAYAAAINGYRPPSLDRFAWCELGCGKGLTALLLAAAHPGASFVACDLNPEHVEYAESMRRAAGVENLRLHARSIAQMLHEDLPQFDFIVMHGVYGWVPAAVRDEIHAFLRRFLKQGGLVFVSYNALPGWTHLEPLRRMFRLLAEMHPGDPAQKVRAALERLKRLAENGAAFFRESPAAAAHLEAIAGRDLRYLAHEYLTPHSTPFDFADVAGAMAQIGLAYAGSATVRNNYAELMAPPQFDALLAEAQSRVELETLRDFIANTRFRRDVYARRPQRTETADPVPLDDLEGLAFCLTGLPEHLPLKASEDGPVDFDIQSDAQAVGMVHALLERGPALPREIHRAAGKAAERETSVLIQKLVVAGHLEPCPPPATSAGWPQINRALVEAALAQRLPEIPLVCPRTSTASYSETLHAAAIEAALCHAEARQACASLLQRLGGTPAHRPTESGRLEPVDEAQIVEYVDDLWRKLRDPASAGARLMRLYGFLA